MGNQHNGKKKDKKYFGFFIEIFPQAIYFRGNFKTDQVHT